MLANDLTRRLGIDHPIMQSGMGGIGDFTLAKLAAAVSNAGALGTVAHPALFLEQPDLAGSELAEATNRAVAQVEAGLVETARLTGRPFALNVRVAREQPDAEWILKRVIELKHDHPGIRDGLVMLSTSGGHPDCYGLNESIRAAGVFHAHAISSVRQAHSAVRAGVDAVVATGFESAGHVGHDAVHSMVLIPAVADAIDLPILAAGGIVDGRSLVAAMVLGARMGYIGTRLLATEECEYHQANKQYILDTPDTGTKVITGFFGPCRHLDTPLLHIIEDMEKAGASDLERLQVEGQGLIKGAIEGDTENGFMIGGMSAGRIHDILPAAEVIKRMVSEAVEAIAKMAHA